jgi:uncharacterized protein YjbI with pentapeptide repeats/energy-coupling factor transporter ATP-binding protein EcfA2
MEALMVNAARLPVRPRVRSAEGSVLLLEDEVLRFLEAGQRGIIAVLGPSGSGKSAALGHLAAILPPGHGVTLLDEPSPAQVPQPGRLVVCMAASVATLPWAEQLLAVYRLAAWTRDDLIEYLLAEHRSRCQAVMARIQPRDVALLGGLPALWRPVLDRLAADDSLPDARRALHRYLEEHLPDTDLLERARSACLNAVVAAKGPPAGLEGLARPGFEASLLRALRYEVVQELLAAERLAADLHGEAACDCLAHRLPRRLVKTAASLLAGDERAVEHLHRLLAGPSWSHAMTASLLHALDASWVPDAGSLPVLTGAYLDGASWPRVHLAGARLEEVDFSEADLRGANLAFAVAHRSSFRQAVLPHACLHDLRAVGADLSGANLVAVQAVDADFTQANLEGADLTDAVLHRVLLIEAKLTGACLRGANLLNASLFQADIREADFTNAVLAGAILTDLPLRQACWEGVDFTGANLERCNLEYLTLPAAVFKGALMRNTLLSGSSMPGADFRGADLRDTGLAEVEWEGADLRDADLRGASFHLGSTRSGLVGSPIACEGSRTGFYTDDFEEQLFKAPEEIRKANLCGADLRGARLDHVDFYLVDLRGAHYDDTQEVHLRRCGAILEARV